VVTARILSGKTALVTGATGRLGRAIALALADEGAAVVAHYCRSGRGAAAWPLQADFREAGSAALLVGKAIGCAGRLDILVNSASLFTESTAGKLGPDDLSENMRVNAWAPLALGRAFSRVAVKGAVVNLLDSRIVGGDRVHAGYIISKHALAVLTREMAREFAPCITVNAVAPGLIGTGREKSAAAGKLPLRRSASPADVAGAVVFLLTSRCITGQVIWVDGGRHVRETGMC
jgi:pteridine reductase